MDYKIKGKKCSEWSVEDLKKALKRRNEKVSGKKQILCDRLRESLKNPIVKKGKLIQQKTKSKIIASIKIKNINDPLFIFYSSLYYQKPNSKMALEELKKYGLTKSKLNSFNNYKELWTYLNI